MSHPRLDGPEAIKFLLKCKDVITQGKEVPRITRRKRK